MCWKTVIGNPDNHWTADASDDRLKSIMCSYIDLQFRFLSRDTSKLISLPSGHRNIQGLNKRGATLVNYCILVDLVLRDVDKSAPRRL